MLARKLLAKGAKLTLNEAQDSAFDLKGATQ
jgi:hypothetical protein